MRRPERGRGSVRSSRRQANSEINRSCRFTMTHMRPVLFYENCGPFFQGCSELDVLFVSFEKRFNAGSEGLIIWGDGGVSGLHMGGEWDTHWSAFRLRRRPSGRVPRFRACRGLRLGCLVPSLEGRFRTRTESCSRMRAKHSG